MNNINEEIILIIQARMGSTRLPQKMILDFHQSKGILEILIEKLQSIFHKNQIVLATTTNSNDDILVKIAENKNVLFFRGNENNVLKRFIDCANYFGKQKIIRVCADNPFLDLDLLKQLISSIEKGININEYISYEVNGIPAIKTHYGFFCEFVTLSTLQKVASATKENLYLEHVTNYIYSHPQSFIIKWLQAPESIANEQDLRLTIDTIDDFNTAKLIYQNVEEPLTYDSIISYVNSRNDLKEIMYNQIHNNEK
jgi:spore coat polysaccharide biosynthesis protein SpsF